MLTLQAAVKDFIAHCIYEKNLSEKTIKSYQTDLKQLLQFISERSLSTEVIKITKTELREFLESISALKPKSIKRKVATIKAMFNYLEFEDKLIANPLRKMRIKIKEPFELPKVLNINEVRDIFRSAYMEKPCAEKMEYRYNASIRNIAVIELLFATGGRVSEIANLKDQDIDLHSGSVTINGKGRKERLINICNKETIDLLKKYRQIFFDKIRLSGNYFLINRLNKKLSDQSIRIIVKNLSEKALIKKHVTPHVFRHSFATLLLEKDVDIKYIQSLLGHSSIMTTQIYTHVNQSKQRQILRQKHPRKDFLMANL